MMIIIVISISIGIIVNSISITITATIISSIIIIISSIISEGLVRNLGRSSFWRYTNADRNQLGWHYSSKATCLMWPHPFAFVFRVKDHHTLLHDQTCLKNTHPVAVSVDPCCWEKGLSAYFSGLLWRGLKPKPPEKFAPPNIPSCVAVRFLLDCSWMCLACSGNSLVAVCADIFFPGLMRRSCGSTKVPPTANLRTYIMDFRGFDASIILIVRGWNSQAHRKFPGKFESNNLSRDNVSREIGRTACCGNELPVRIREASTAT